MRPMVLIAPARNPLRQSAPSVGFGAPSSVPGPGETQQSGTSPGLDGPAFDGCRVGIRWSSRSAPWPARSDAHRSRQGRVLIGPRVAPTRSWREGVAAHPFSGVPSDELVLLMKAKSLSAPFQRRSARFWRQRPTMAGRARSPCNAASRDRTQRPPCIPLLHTWGRVLYKTTWEMCGSGPAEGPPLLEPRGSLKMQLGARCTVPRSDSHRPTTES